MVARFSTDGHSWSNHIPSSAGDIQGGYFLRCVLSLFSRSFRFSHRGYFQLGSLLYRGSPLFFSMFGHYYAVARARASANHYRRPDTTGVSIPITYPFVYFAALRVTDLTALLYSARIPSLPYYTSCISNIILT